MSVKPAFNLNDTVILAPVYGDFSVERIVKVTKSHAYISDSCYFDRFTGNKPGSSPWCRPCLYVATDEWIAEIQAFDKKASLMSRVQKINWTLLSVDQLERVIAIAEKEQIAAASCDLADVKAHLAQVSSEKIRLEADLVIERERNLNNVANADLRIAELQADIAKWKQLLSNEMELNLMNVRDSDWQIKELQARLKQADEMIALQKTLADEFTAKAQAEITHLRDEMQALVGRLTNLADDIDRKAIDEDDERHLIAERLREAISGEGEK